MDFVNKIINEDCLTGLQKLPDGSIDCCVTSPPYYGLRDYGCDDQIGIEDTPELYIERLSDVFDKVKRVLKDDGTLWLNLGDSYAGSWGNSGGQNRGKGTQRSMAGNSITKDADTARHGSFVPPAARGFKDMGIKPKDLIGIPWRVAFALQADGWYLRQDIIWHKPNPMPESVKDRCTKAHEYIFLLSKNAKYYYDNEAIKEDAKFPDGPNTPSSIKAVDGVYSANLQKIGANPKRNKRSVWTVTTKPYSEAHFATFPPDLILPCILAGCPEDGVVLDPFMGSGTTAVVARKLGRKFTGFELNKGYLKIANERLYREMGMFL